MIPPHNKEAEQSVLGSILLDNEIIEDINLDVADFYSIAHQKIYSAMLELYKKGEPIDILILNTHLKERGELENVGDTAYLTFLSSTVPTAANAIYYSDMVKNDAKKRSVKNIATIMHGDIVDVDSTIDNALNRLSGLQLVGNNETVMHVGHGLQETVNSFIDPNNEDMISTGLSDLDRRMGGFVKGGYTVIGGRTSMGKTAFMLSMAYRQACAGHPVLIFSLEMTRQVLQKRLLCFKNLACFHDLHAGRNLDSQGTKITDAGAFVNDLPIYIDETANLTTLEMDRRLRRAQKDYGIEVVYVDYLQKIKPTANRNRNREQEVAEISRDLHAMAKTRYIPLIALAQVNRKVEERVNKRPKMSDIRECGAIEQDVDDCWIVYRDEYYNPQTEDIGIIEINREKARNGSVGTTKLAFIAESMLVADLQRDYNYR